jgi:hypothetical protein
MYVDVRVWRGFNSWGRTLRNPPRLLQSNKAVHHRLIVRNFAKDCCQVSLGRRLISF